jgi:hypothetical protein
MHAVFFVALGFEGFPTLSLAGALPQSIFRTCFIQVLKFQPLISCDIPPSGFG